MTDARENERVTINKEFDSVIGGFSLAPAGVNPAGPHPRVWGPGPKQVPS